MRHCRYQSISGTGRIMRPFSTTMLRSMQHRGPDATGLYLSGPGRPWPWTRLSIIDLTGGHQPIHNEDRTVWIVFNGEIFNYPELRSHLVEKGHTFYTQSDTEVMVHLYEEHGAGLFEHLNGQFAIAIWDQRKRTPAVGPRPHGHSPAVLPPAGSPPARRIGNQGPAVTDPRVPRQLNRQTLNDVFTCWTPVDPLTAFEGIYQLPPGHWAKFSDQGLTIQRYWQLDFTETGPIRSQQDWARQMQNLLLDAARIRLRADVPVGAYTERRHRFNLYQHPRQEQLQQHAQHLFGSIQRQAL